MRRDPKDCGQNLGTYQEVHCLLYKPGKTATMGHWLKSIVSY